MDKEIQQIQQLIEQFKTTEGEPCAYCGLLATEKEHVIPLSYFIKLKKMKELDFKIKIPKNKIVPSCRECNMIAYNKVFNNFGEKKAYIREQLYERYKKFAKGPKWTDKEISELKGRLKEYVILMREVKRIIKKRLNYRK